MAGNEGENEMTPTPECTLTRLAFELSSLGEEHRTIQMELNKAAWYCTQWQEEVSRLEAEVVAALPAMRDYALRNPKYIYNVDMQDPKGVHAWLKHNEPPNVIQDRVK